MNAAISNPKRIVRPLAIILVMSGILSSAKAQQRITDQAITQFMTGNFTKAQSLATDAIEQDKNNALAYAILGRVLVTNNDLVNAQVNYDKALRLSPNNGAVFAFKAACYEYQEKNDLAKKAYDKAYSLLSSPATSLDYYARGTVNDYRKNADAAFADYTKALELNPQCAVCYVKRARIYADKQQSDAALSEYNNALRINPDYSALYFSRGTLYYERRQYDKAAEDYTKSLQYKPGDVDALFNRGVMYKMQGKLDLALADYARVAQLSPNDADLYGNRGNVYYLQNKMAEAYNDYSKAIRLNPKKALYYLNRGSVYTRWEQYDSAFADYNTAVNLNPGYTDALIERGNIYMNQKQQPELGLADYRRVLEIDPKYSNAWMNIGVYYHNKESFSQAIENYNKAIEADPKNMLAYLNRASAYESIGNSKLANQDKKKYVDLGGKLEPSGSSGYKEIYPEGVFDAKMAADALGRGTSSIAGRACTKKDGLIFSAAGVKVRLFPVTPYLEEWHKLRDKKEGAHTGVFMSKEANKYSIEAISGADGRFVFEGLKPGRYFIQLVHSFNQRKTAHIYTGSYTSQNGPVMTTTNYYYDQDYLVARSQRLERFVEIDKDGQFKKITLANGLIKSCDF